MVINRKREKRIVRMKVTLEIGKIVVHLYQILRDNATNERKRFFFYPLTRSALMAICMYKKATLRATLALR